MEIKGITPDVFEAIVRRVSSDRYDCNVMCKDQHPTRLNGAGTRFRQRIIVESSRGAGARRSWSGRRMPCACWHVFRDVVRATLAEHPKVTFRTSLAYYTSDNFETTYPPTGYVNVGSAFQPARLPELCECDESDNGAPGVVPCRTARVVVPERVTPPVRAVPLGPHWSVERDQALAIAASECAWCGGSTAHLGEVFAWCSQECQERWQDKYGAGLDLAP